MHAAINSIAKIPSLEHRSRLCWRLWVSVTLTVTITPCQAGRALVGTLPVQTPMWCPMWRWQWGRRWHWPHQEEEEQYVWRAGPNPLAIETSGVFGPGTYEFVSELCRRLTYLGVRGSTRQIPHDQTNLGCCAERKCCFCVWHLRTLQSTWQLQLHLQLISFCSTVLLV